MGLLLGFDQDLERFANLLTTFKVVLGDDEEKQFSNRAIEIWLQNLKDAVLELEDIMNEYAYEEVKYCLRLPEMVQYSRLSLFHPKHVIFCYEIAKRMRRIYERLDEILKKEIN